MTQILTTSDIEKCKQVCKNILDKQEPIGVDAEGLSLGIKGRLTLLQIATADGQVYIIDVVDHRNIQDVQPGKILLIEGGIKDVLESQSVLKIIHGCYSDSGALYHQFGIRLQNVFDTQCANLTIQTLQEDRKIPEKVRLEIIIEKYGTVSHSSKDFRAVWKSEKEYWLKRPLTTEAINYATEDVVLLHQVYYNMKKIIDEVNGWECLNEWIDLQVNEQIEQERVEEAVTSKRINNAQLVLKEIQPEHSGESFTKDELEAFRVFRKYKDQFRNLQNFKKLQELEIKCCEFFIAEIYGQLQSGTLHPDNILEREGGKIRAFISNHENINIHQKHQKLMKDIHIAIVKHRMTEIKEKHAQMEIQNYTDLNQKEIEALTKFYELKSHLNSQEIPSIMTQLENEMILKWLSRWEDIIKTKDANQEIAGHDVGQARSLAKSADQHVRKRASAMVKDLKIFSMLNTVKKLEMRIDEVDDVSALTNAEKFDLATIREYRGDIDTSQFHSKILQLEEEISSCDLHKWENWNKSGQLFQKAGGFEKAVIRTLTTHPNQSLSSRAKALYSKFLRGKKSGSKGSKS